ncbi:hypothetical protein HanRHA438_Chr15g0710261 [Helianthus annuus]|nr:hypothetical protein HanRHA438_Chr15g0710261 [Helianthus annuus]
MYGYIMAQLQFDRLRLGGVKQTSTQTLHPQTVVQHKSYPTDLGEEYLSPVHDNPSPPTPDWGRLPQDYRSDGRDNDRSVSPPPGNILVGMGTIRAFKCLIRN